MSGTWDDDPKNWGRAFRSTKPPDVRVIHSRYWRSAHWSYEFQYFFEIAPNAGLKQQLFAANKLRRLVGDEAVAARANRFRDAPSWFARGAGKLRGVGIRRRTRTHSRSSSQGVGPHVHERHQVRSCWLAARAGGLRPRFLLGRVHESAFGCRRCLRVDRDCRGSASGTAASAGTQPGRTADWPPIKKLQQQDIDAPLSRDPLR